MPTYSYRYRNVQILREDEAWWSCFRHPAQILDHVRFRALFMVRTYSHISIDTSSDRSLQYQHPRGFIHYLPYHQARPRDETCPHRWKSKVHCCYHHRERVTLLVRIDLVYEDGVDKSASYISIFNIMTLVSLLAGSNLQFIWLSAVSQ
jgi:hypothetical protein